MNVATIFPLWPGNIGLLQAAVALPLVQYGVPYSVGFAYALVLQVIEMSVGVGVGLIFLAREGLSFASLRDMPEESEAPAADEDEETHPPERRSCARSRARLASRASSRQPTAAAALAEGLRAGGCRRGRAADRRRRRGHGGRALARSRRRLARGRRARCLRCAAAGSLARSPGRHRGRRGSSRGPARSGRLEPLDGVEPRIRRARRRRPRGRGGRARARRSAARPRWTRARAFSRSFTELPVPALVACDVTATLAEAPRVFGPQKGAGPDEIAELERRFAARDELVSYRDKPFTGAAGGLGAALASLGAELVPGAPLRARRGRVRRLGVRPRRHRRGPRRRDDGARQGARRGRAARRRNALRRLRRASSSWTCRARRRWRCQAIPRGRGTISSRSEETCANRR